MLNMEMDSDESLRDRGYVVSKRLGRVRKGGHLLLATSKWYGVHPHSDSIIDCCHFWNHHPISGVFLCTPPSPADSPTWNKPIFGIPWAYHLQSIEMGLSRQPYSYPLIVAYCSLISISAEDSADKPSNLMILCKSRTLPTRQTRGM